MALRACVYKNCENFVNKKHRRDADITMFTFPKNPERRQKWIELGKVPPNIPDSMCYFCSDHFEKRYLCIQSKRTILVGEAVPVPFVEEEFLEDNEDISHELENYLYEVENGSDSVENEFVEEESLSRTSEQFSNYLANKQDVELLLEDDAIYIQKSIIDNSNKRKLHNTQIQTTPQKSKILKLSSHKETLPSSLKIQNDKTSKTLSKPSVVLSEDDSETAQAADGDIDQVVDSQHVATFVYKDKEYVRMSKDYYIKEKMGLIKELQKIKSTLSVIKEHISALDT